VGSLLLLARARAWRESRRSLPYFSCHLALHSVALPSPQPFTRGLDGRRESRGIDVVTMSVRPTGDQMTLRAVGVSRAATWRTCVVDVLLLLAACGAVGLLVPIADERASERAVLVLAAVALLLALGAALGLYPVVHRPGSFDDTVTLWATVLGSMLIVLGLDGALGYPLPVAALVVVTLVALVVMSAAHWLVRLLEEHRQRPSRAPHRVVVFGAGEAGEQIVRALLRNPDSEYLPVVVLDDDPRKARQRVLGVPLAGGRTRLKEVARQYRADMLLIAVPSGDRQLVAELADAAGASGLGVRVLPPVEELLMQDRVEESDIRPLTCADLLGRPEVLTERSAIPDYVVGKRVLVTGAGGSIGSELCRQLATLGVSELIMLDRDESALHAVQLSLHGRALLDDDSLVVADIRDRYRMRDIMVARRPQVVFHTAALKHLPLLERYPIEAVKTNVWGTWNVLEAVVAAGVEHFVNVSTDKAADPSSVLGWSKRIGERLTAAEARRTGMSLVSVRFGNVLGSRGSVLTAFRAQILAGGPVTVTDPDVTRFFMTVEEAVALVVQAGALGGPGEVMVLDMGRPVRIAQVAERLVAEHGRPVDIVYTGLRPGEKLHEVLLAADERDVRPRHPLISHVPVPPLGVMALSALDGLRDREPLVTALRLLSGSHVIDLAEQRVEVVAADLRVSS
jgi:FlaA1/EpsC-like NDP-sugar epimerase